MFRRTRSRLAHVALLLALALTAGARVWAAEKYTPPKEARSFKPEELRQRLAAIDSADVARACGNMFAPWAYRGPRGRHMAMRTFGRTRVDAQHARAFAACLLSDNTIDSAFKAATEASPCDPATGKPIYLAIFYARDRATFALVNFDYGTAMFFDGEEPLGMVVMGAGGDSAWAVLASVLLDDPPLRGARPQPRPAGLTGLFRPDITDLPEVLEKAKPNYPPEALDQGLWGEVYIQAKVGVDGTVRDAYVDRGEPLLRDAALEAVWKWRFKPAGKNGEPTEVWVGVPVRFNLR